MSAIVPPFSEEIEECLLGSLLIDPGALPAVREIIKEPGDFHIEVNRAVYSAMCRLADDGLAIGVVTVCAMLSKAVAAQTVALGASDYEPRLTRYLYTTEADDETYFPMTIISYARIVRGLKVRRLAIMAMERSLPHILDWQNGNGIDKTLGLLADYLTSLRNGVLRGATKEE